MRALDLRLAAALAVVFACGEKPTPPAAAPRAEPPPSAAPVAPAPAAPPEQKVGAAEAAKPAPAAPVQAPAAKPVTPTAAAPAARPASAPASAHAKVGADKCRMCHRVQHQSWAESAHATKGLDCEACHGNGGDYWPAAVMRDRAKAVAAGLVLPGVARCKACHATADAALLTRVHAHKAR